MWVILSPELSQCQALVKECHAAAAKERHGNPAYHHQYHSAYHVILHGVADGASCDNCTRTVALPCSRK